MIGRTGWTSGLVLALSLNTVRQEGAFQMKIIEVRAVYPRWARPASDAWQSHFWQIAVRVTSDTGHVGWGYGGGGRPAVQIVNQHLSRFVIGRGIESTEDIRATWQSLYRASLPYGRGGIAMMALSGVDLALWDLLGHSMDAPVYELLGVRKREPVEAYASGTHFQHFRDLGFSNTKIPVKWRAPTDYVQTEEMVADARKVFGPDGKVMLDCYMSWDVSTTLEMRRRLDSYQVFWFEDVLTPDHHVELAELRPRLAPVMSAGGEHEFTAAGFKKLAEAGSLDVWQPDITWCGGMTGALAILTLAESGGIPICLHRGGEVWGLHLIVGSDCMGFAEILQNEREVGQLRCWLGEPEVRDGFLYPTDRPGFGVSPNLQLF